MAQSNEGSRPPLCVSNNLIRKPVQENTSCHFKSGALWEEEKTSVLKLGGFILHNSKVERCTKQKMFTWIFQAGSLSQFKFPLSGHRDIYNTEQCEVQPLSREHPSTGARAPELSTEELHASFMQTRATDRVPLTGREPTTSHLRWSPAEQNETDGGYTGVLPKQSTQMTYQRFVYFR